MIAIARRDPMRPRMADPAPDQTRMKHSNKDKEKLLDPADNPGTGRSSQLGRKAESPASIRSSGPSGQSGRAKHQSRHPNK